MRTPRLAMRRLHLTSFLGEEVGLSIYTPCTILIHVETCLQPWNAFKTKNLGKGFDFFDTSKFDKILSLYSRQLKIRKK